MAPTAVRGSDADTGGPAVAHPEAPVSLANDAVDFCSRLIRFDTTNHGGGRARGEREAADWVAATLAAAGWSPAVLEAAPGRASTVARLPGRDRTAPALLVHAHLDVVPAEAGDWSVDPFGGLVRDGAVWGRGALDMKDMAAMTLAVAVEWGRSDFVPPRDVVLAFVADEEDTGELGAGFLVREHRSLFAGVTTAIGESGGHLVHLPDCSHLYPVATGERGTAWLRLTAHGHAGHGSARRPDNAVATLARALVRLVDHDWPVQVIPTVAALLDGLSAHLGIHLDPGDPESLAALGDAADLVTPTLANTVNPTMLNAGYKVNVIPGEATACVDGRILPGTEGDFLTTVQGLLGPGITTEVLSYAAPVSAGHGGGGHGGGGHDGPEFASMAAALRAHDPGALVLPYCMSGGTDAKAFSELGAACYGFAPARTPAGFRYDGLVHGVDEHVLISSLHFGVRVLDTYLRTEPPMPADAGR